MTVFTILMVYVVGGELSAGVEEALVKHWSSQMPDGHTIVVSETHSYDKIQTDRSKTMIQTSAL